MQSDLPKSVWIGCLKPRLTDDEVAECFRRGLEHLYPEIQCSAVAKDRGTGKDAYAIVEFDEHDHAKAAIETFQGKRVSITNPMKAVVNSYSKPSQWPRTHRTEDALGTTAKCKPASSSVATTAPAIVPKSPAPANASTIVPPPPSRRQRLKQELSDEITSIAQGLDVLESLSADVASDDMAKEVSTAAADEVPQLDEIAVMLDALLHNSKQEMASGSDGCAEDGHVLVDDYGGDIRPKKRRSPMNYTNARKSKALPPDDTSST